MKKINSAICHCLSGGFLSILTIWIVGIVFCRNYVPCYYDPVIKRNIWQPDITVHMTKEGFADTKTGYDGQIAPDENWDTNKDIILVMGNSFIEGMHVADRDKIHQVINRELKSAKINVCAINVGMSSQSVADCLWQLPQYCNKYGKRIRAVVIVLSGGSYMMRPQAIDYTGGGDVNQDGTLLLLHPRVYQQSKIGQIKYQFRLNSFLVLGSKSKNIHLNFIPGPHYSIPVQPKNSISWEQTIRYQDAWIAYLHQIAPCPVLLLMTEENPTIQNGAIVPAQQAAISEIIRKNAAAHRIDFLDLTDTFNVFALQHRKLVTGLLNTPPGTGHWNEDGHRIAAKAISDWYCGLVQSSMANGGK